MYFSITGRVVPVLVAVGLATALQGATQSIVVTNPAGQGTAEAPILLEAPLGITPGAPTVSRTVTINIDTETPGIFVLQGISGGSWASVSGLGAAGATTTFVLTANLAQARAGVNDAALTVAYQSTAGAGTLATGTLYVRLILGSTITGFSVNANPGSLSFAGLPFGTTSSQGVAVTSNSATPVTFTVSAVTNTGVGWLSVNNPGITLTTPAVVLVTVNTQGLVANQFAYGGTIILTPTNGGPPTAVPVSLTVAASNPRLQVSQTSIAFTHQSNTAVAAPRTVMATTSGSGASTGFSVQSTTFSGGSWLQVQQGAFSTPSPFLVSLVPSVVSGLPPGFYSGQITVVAGGAENSPLQIPVSLTVSASPQLTLSSYAPIVFNAASGLLSVPSQTISVGSSSSFPVPVSLSVQGGNWLSATLSQSQTPAVLTIGAVPGSFFSTGTFSGSVTVSSSGGSLTIPVTLNVSSQNELAVNRTELQFSGNGVQTQTITVSSTNASAGFTAQAVVTTPAGGNWLQVTQTTSLTSGVVQVTVVPQNLGAGVYYGHVVITSPGLTPVYVPVTLTAAVPLAVNPLSLTFALQQGQALPPAQTFAVVSSVATAFSVSQSSAAGNLLDITPLSGVTNAVLQVRPNAAAASLPVGAYLSTILVAGPGIGTIELPVTLTVSPAVAVNASPQTLVFTARERSGQSPSVQTLTVTASGGAAQGITVGVRTSDGGNWLSASPASAQTPAAITVEVNAGNLAAGSYAGMVTVTVSGAPLAPVLQIPVSLTVERVAAPTITQAVNGASFQPGALAPGLITTLFGSNLGPATGAGVQLTQIGRVARTVAGVRVLFDGIEAPLLFVRTDQINCVVPYAMTGRAEVAIQVENNGILSNQIRQRMNDTAPAIFNLGGGQAAVLNQNNTVNGPANPADRGQIAVLYLTGEGALTPPGVDGEVTTTVKGPIAPVQVSVGGVEVTSIQFAGSAPGLVQGVMQINFLIPPNVPVGGAVPVAVTIGGVNSPAGITMAVR